MAVQSNVLPYFPTKEKAELREREEQVLAEPKKLRAREVLSDDNLDSLVKTCQAGGRPNRIDADRVQVHGTPLRSSSQPGHRGQKRRTIPFITDCEVLFQVFWSDIRDVAHDALEVANLFEDSDMLTAEMDIQLHAPPRSRRNSLSVPALPNFVKVSSSPSTANTVISFRAPNSDGCPFSTPRRGLKH